MNAQNISGTTNVQEIAYFYSKNKNTVYCVSFQKTKWTSIAPKPEV